MNCLRVRSCLKWIDFHLASLDVSSHINISSLPEGPVPGLVGKLMRMGSKFKKKLNVPDVIVYD